MMPLVSSTILSLFLALISLLKMAFGSPIDRLACLGYERKEVISRASQPPPAGFDFVPRVLQVSSAGSKCPAIACEVKRTFVWKLLGLKFRRSAPGRPTSKSLEVSFLPAVWICRKPRTDYSRKPPPKYALKSDRLTLSSRANASCVRLEKHQSSAMGVQEIYVLSCHVGEDY